MNFYHLLCEKNKTVSIGRLSFWIVFIFLCIFWGMILFHPEVKEAPESLLYGFYSLLAYNLGKKFKKVEKVSQLLEE